MILRRFIEVNGELIGIISNGCEYCANYFKCENTSQNDCFEEIRTLYDVIPDGLVYDVNDFSSVEKERINWFFKTNYGFMFEDIHNKAFQVQLANAIHRTKRARDIIIEMARTVIANRIHPKWHKAIKWNCFNMIDIETDAGITEEEAKAVFFRLPDTDDVLITQVDYETDPDDEVTLYVYIENGNPDEYLQETLDWSMKLTEKGFENSLSDENYEGYDVVIIYYGGFSS